VQSESGGGAALSEMEAEDPTTESVETEPKAGEESPGPATEPMEEGADERSTEATETAADEAATGVEGEAEEGGEADGDGDDFMPGGVPPVSIGCQTFKELCPHLGAAVCVVSGPFNLEFSPNLHSSN
jgi:hypothetical protein